MLSSESQAGFSLLELLVAFAILAMSLGLIYRSMGESARNANELASYQQASLLADGILTAQESVNPGGWSESGVSGQFRWEVMSKPFVVPNDTLPVLRLHQISVVVSWLDFERNRVFRIETLLPERAPLPAEVVK